MCGAFHGHAHSMTMPCRSEQNGPHSCSLSEGRIALQSLLMQALEWRRRNQERPLWLSQWVMGPPTVVALNGAIRSDRARPSHPEQPPTAALSDRWRGTAGPVTADRPQSETISRVSTMPTLTLAAAVTVQCGRSLAPSTSWASRPSGHPQSERGDAHRRDTRGSIGTSMSSVKFVRVILANMRYRCTCGESAGTPFTDHRGGATRGVVDGSRSACPFAD